MHCLLVSQDRKLKSHGLGLRAQIFCAFHNLGVERSHNPEEKNFGLFDPEPIKAKESVPQLMGETSFIIGSV